MWTKRCISSHKSSSVTSDWVRIVVTSIRSLVMASFILLLTGTGRHTWRAPPCRPSRGRACGGGEHGGLWRNTWQRRRRPWRGISWGWWGHGWARPAGPVCPPVTMWQLVLLFFPVHCLTFKNFIYLELFCFFSCISFFFWGGGGFIQGQCGRGGFFFPPFFFFCMCVHMCVLEWEMQSDEVAKKICFLASINHMRVFPPWTQKEKRKVSLLMASVSQTDHWFKVDALSAYTHV